MEYFILSICLLFLGAILSIIVPEQFKLKLCSIFTLIAAIFAVIPAGSVFVTGEPIFTTLQFSPIFGNIDVVIDPLSAVFVCVISIMSFLGTVYANGYMKPYLNNGMHVSSHCFFLMMLIASMLSVVTIQNGLFFLIAWELMSLSSFFLVIFEGHKKEVIKAGIKYLVYMHLSVIFIIAMMALLTNASGEFSFLAYTQAVARNPQLASLAFILGFIGFGIKAGFVPFHNWLPEGHPAAPTHVSAIMSGVMIKTGIYGILRTLFITGTPSKGIAYTVLIIATISALYGVLYATTQRDIKKLLADCSIENIGIIGIGLGVGMLGLAYNNNVIAIFGFTGSILHIINHSIFKMLTFFGAGCTYLKTHTRDMEQLGGLIKKMPWTGSMFILGSIAICGLPPFNGFVSEFLIYAGMLLGIPASDITLFIALVLTIGALAMVGTMALMCFTKASGIMFLGEARTDKVEHVTSDCSLSMIIPMGILTISTLLIGLFPQSIIKLVLMPVIMFVNNTNILPVLTDLVAVIQTISFLFLIFMIVLVVTLAIKAVLNRNSEEHGTWGCGYNRLNSHVQYTGSSFANLFISTLKPLFKRVSHIKKPKELFPKDAYYELEIEDIEEAYIVNPVLKWDEKILAKFERIQNGNIQQYILIGLIFLLIAIAGVIWIG